MKKGLFLSFLYIFLIGFPLSSTIQGRDLYRAWRKIERTSSWKNAQYFKEESVRLAKKNKLTDAWESLENAAKKLENLQKQAYARQKEFQDLETDYDLISHDDWQDIIEVLADQIASIKEDMAGIITRLAKRTKNKQNKDEYKKQASYCRFQAAKQRYQSIRSRRTMSKIPSKKLTKIYQRDLKRFEKAIASINPKSLKLRKNYDWFEKEMLAKDDLNYLADIYVKFATHQSIDNLPQAIKALKKAAKHYKNAGNLRKQAQTISTLAEYYEQTGKKSEARKMYLKAAKIYDKLYKNVHLDKHHEHPSDDLRCHANRIKKELKKKKEITRFVCLDRNVPFTMENLIEARKKKIKRYNQLLKEEAYAPPIAKKIKARIKKMLQGLPCTEKSDTDNFCYTCYEKEYLGLPKEVEKKASLAKDLEQKAQEQKRKKEKKKKDEFGPLIRQFKRAYAKAKKEKDPKKIIKKLHGYFQTIPPHIARHIFNNVLAKKSEKELIDDLRKQYKLNAEAIQETSIIAAKYYNKVGLTKKIDKKIPKELFKLAKKWAQKGIPLDVTANTWLNIQKSKIQNAIKFCLETNPELSGRDIENSRLSRLVPPDQLKRILFKQRTAKDLQKLFGLAYHSRFLQDSQHANKLEKVSKQIKEIGIKINQIKKNLLICDIDVKRLKSNIIKMAFDMGQKSYQQHKKKMEEKRKRGEGGEAWYQTAWKSIPRTGEALWYLTAGNIVTYYTAIKTKSWEKGFEAGADFIDSRRKLANSCYGSILGTDEEMVNKDLLQIGMSLNPLGQLGKGVGAVFKGMSEVYKDLVSWRLGITREEYNKALRERGNLALKAGYYGWEVFKGAGSLALYLYMSGYGATAKMAPYKAAGFDTTTKAFLKVFHRNLRRKQMVAIGKMLKSSGGMSLVGAVGNELVLASQDGKKIVNAGRFFRILKHTGAGMVQNISYMSLMGAAGIAYGNFVKKRLLKYGAHSELAREVGIHHASEISSALDVLEGASSMEEVIPAIFKAKEWKEMVGQLLNAGVEIFDMFGDLKVAGVYQGIKQGVSLTSAPKMSIRALYAIYDISDNLNIKVDKNNINQIIDALLKAKDKKGIEKAKKILAKAGLSQMRINSFIPHMLALRAQAIKSGHIVEKNAQKKLFIDNAISIANNIRQQNLNAKSKQVTQLARQLSRQAITPKERLKLAQAILGLSNIQIKKLASAIKKSHRHDGGVKIKKKKPGIFQYPAKVLVKKKKILIQALVKQGYARPDAIKKADLLVRSGICGNPQMESAQEHQKIRMVGTDGTPLTLKVNDYISVKNKSGSMITGRIVGIYDNLVYLQTNTNQEYQINLQEGAVFNGTLHQFQQDVPQIDEILVLSDSQKDATKLTALAYLPNSAYVDNDPKSLKLKKNIRITAIGDLYIKNNLNRNLFQRMVPGAATKTIVDQLDDLTYLAANNKNNIKLLLGNHDMGMVLSLIQAKQKNPTTFLEIFNIFKDFDLNEDYSTFESSGETQAIFMQQLWTLSGRKLDLSPIANIQAKFALRKQDRKQAIEKVYDIVLDQIKKLSSDDRNSLINNLKLRGDSTPKQIMDALAVKTLNVLNDKLQRQWDHLLNVMDQHENVLSVHAGINNNVIDAIESAGGPKKYNELFREKIHKALAGDKAALNDLLETYSNKDISPLLVPTKETEKLGKFCKKFKITRIHAGHDKLYNDARSKEVYEKHLKKADVTLFSGDNFDGQVTLYKKGHPRPYYPFPLGDNQQSVSDLINLAKQIHSRGLDGKSSEVSELASKISQTVLSQYERIQLAKNLLNLSNQDIRKLAPDIHKVHLFVGDEKLLKDQPVIFKYPKRVLAEKKQMLIRAIKKHFPNETNAEKKADLLVRSGICGISSKLLQMVTKQSQKVQKYFKECLNKGLVGTEELIKQLDMISKTDQGKLLAQALKDITNPQNFRRVMHGLRQAILKSTSSFTKKAETIINGLKAKQKTLKFIKNAQVNFILQKNPAYQDLLQEKNKLEQIISDQSTNIEAQQKAQNDLQELNKKIESKLSESDNAFTDNMDKVENILNNITDQNLKRKIFDLFADPKSADKINEMTDWMLKAACSCNRKFCKTTR